MEIEVVPALELAPGVRSEILALCTDAYEEDFTPYLNLLGSAVHVLVRLNGALVSHAAWVERELRASNLARPLKAAYVEAVATPIALQRRGYGSASTGSNSAAARELRPGRTIAFGGQVLLSAGLGALGGPARIPARRAKRSRRRMNGS